MEGGGSITFNGTGPAELPLRPPPAVVVPGEGCQPVERRRHRVQEEMDHDVGDKEVQRAAQSSQGPQVRRQQAGEVERDPERGPVGGVAVMNVAAFVDEVEVEQVEIWQDAADESHPEGPARSQALPGAHGRFD